jgi:hypothetical protein
LPSAKAVTAQNGVAYLFDTRDVPELLVEITTLLRDRNIAVTELRAGIDSLEDVFLRLTGKEYSE